MTRAAFGATGLIEHGILSQMGEATYGRLYVASAVMDVLRDNVTT